MTKYKLAKKREKKVSWIVLCCLGLCLIGAGVGIFYLKPQWLPMNFAEDKKVETTTPKKVEKKEEKPKTDLPQVSTKDWNLVLINRNNKLAELNPQLVDVEEIKVDSRIAEQTKQFLAAARAIAPEESLISGYRSVEEQTEIYNERVAQLEATGLPHEEAERQAQTQVQVPGASEHQTGLAIDMSTVDSLNEADPDTVAKVKELAPKYGFVLRFPDGKTSSTGVGYEDWHFRYVGKESAEYMTEHNLTLEEYLALLKEKSK